MSRASFPAVQQIWLKPLHPGQVRAYRALIGHRFMALRCGRRFGKTALAKNWAAQSLLQGEEVGWFAPEHKHMAEVYADLKATLASLLVASAKTPPALRLPTGGRVDFWSLENPISACGRRYHRVVIDEAAFAKDGGVNSYDSMMAIWEKAIKPTLFDYGSTALVCSNSAGKNPDNFFYNLCNDPQYGFVEFHAKASSQVQQRRSGEGLARAHGEVPRRSEGQQRSAGLCAGILRRVRRLVRRRLLQREKLLVNDQPVPPPSCCDSVFAVIETAVKTGTDNDGTAVTFFGYDQHAPVPL